MRISWPLSSVITAVCFMTRPFAWRPSELAGSLLHDLHGLDAVATLDAVDGVHAAGHAAEDRVVAVEEVGGTERDVELAAGRVGILRARHGDDAAVVLLLVELRLQRVAGSAGAEPRVARGERLGERVAALHHEARLDAVKRGAVVEAVLRQLDEVLHGLRRVSREELDRDLSALLERDDGALLRLGAGAHGDGEQAHDEKREETA